MNPAVRARLSTWYSRCDAWEGADAALRRSPAQSWFRRRAATRLAVLGYHGVEDAARFATHLDLIQSGWTPVSLHQVEEALHGGRPLPPRAAVRRPGPGDRHPPRCVDARELACNVGDGREHAARGQMRIIQRFRGIAKPRARNSSAIESRKALVHGVPHRPPFDDLHHRVPVRTARLHRDETGIGRKLRQACQLAKRREIAR